MRVINLVIVVGLLCAAIPAHADSNASVSRNTATAPTSSTQIGCVDGSGNLQAASAATPCPVVIESSGTTPVIVVPAPSVSTGFQQVTGLTSAKSFTAPTGSTYCNVVSTGAAITFRTDGTAPTASIGYPLAINQPASFRMSVANLSAIQFIQQAATAVLNVDCYQD